MVKHAPDTTAPYVRASFINALAEEGTKEEAIFALQKQWDKNCALRAAMQKLRAHVIEECAVAAEQQDRAGYEWVRESLWANILHRAGANVRKLKVDSTLSAQERS